jgi:hypothetical protein
MSRQTKIVLGIVAGALGLCLCVAVLGVFALGAAGVSMARTVEISNQRVSPAGSEIAGYEVPDGWQHQYAVHVMGFSMVGMSGPDGHSHIMLIQVPEGRGTGKPNLQQMLDQAASMPQYRATTRGLKLQQVGQTETTIRGQQVRLMISEGVDAGARPYRQMTGVFQGPNGPTLLIIAGPSETWDQALFDRFIASIR